MSLAAAIRTARSPSAALAAVGLFAGGFAACVPEIKPGVNATDAEFGLAMMMAAAGSITMLAVAPRLIARLGRNALTIAGAAMLLVFLYPLVPETPAGFAVAMALVGVSLTFLDIGANIEIARLETRHRRHLMNVGHAMFSFGFAAAALFASVMRRFDADTPTIFGILMLAALVLVRLMGPGLPRPAAEAAAPGAAGPPWVPVLLTASILFISFVAENATEVWSALHIERTLQGAHGLGGFGPVALGLTMGFGRLAGQVLAERIGEVRLIQWSTVAGAVGAAVTGIAAAPVVAVCGIAFIGIGVAVVVPSANSILVRLVRPDQGPLAISRAWMLGFSGFFLGPSLMGLVAESWGLRAVFLVLAAVLLLAVPLVQRLGSRRTAAQA
ncbi:MAG: MFS transporter [Defluviimonas sp.]|uniref:MFS transporter n=1 Tax=Albidovulum sp. TaxID=1872424 RepID=UPI001DD29233|nr:MFS transporter [Paracoccaceae bacterium]MCC0063653.1 MFS transporter [Defluviimonas sp.]